MRASRARTTAEVILWHDRAIEEILSELSIAPPVGALSTPSGTFLHGVLAEGRHGVHAHAGARVFVVAHRERVWREDGAAEIDHAELDALLRDADPRSALLLARDGALLLPDPTCWPVVEIALERGDVTATLPESRGRAEILPRTRVHLVPCAPRGSRAGILERAGRGRAFGAAFAERSIIERRDLWRGDRGPLWWIYGPRGLADELPRAGRSLTNLSTPAEPVLVPTNRRPEPALGGRALRSVFGLADGEGLLWWDGDRGEHAIVFRRSDLRRLDDESAIVDLEW